MPRTTKLDRLRDEYTDALNALTLVAQAQRDAIAALPETAALTAASNALEAAQASFLREQEASNRRKHRAEIRTEYVVRDIDAHGDAVDSFVFSSWDNAKAFAIRRSAPAVAIDRERDGNSETVWRSGDADALAAWEGNDPA
jgi:hypothetical protein